MDPDTNPQPPSPQYNTPQPGFTPPQQPVYQQPPMPTKKNRLPLIIGVVFALIVAMVAILSYVSSFLPGAQASKTSTAFMEAITTNNPDKAFSYTDGSNGAKEFINSVAKDSEGIFKLEDTQSQDGRHYYLYSLTNPTNKYARTTLDQENGKWRVAAYSISPNKLATIPSESNATETAPVPSPSSSIACLVATDFDDIYISINGAARPANLDYSASSFGFTQNVHFKPDSLEFSSPTQDQGMVSNFANFGKTKADKQFKIRIKGSVATTTPADLNFANQRAEKIKGILVSGGVDSTRIVIDTPQNVATSGGSTSNAAAKQTARNVVITIDATCSSPTVPSSGR